MTRSRPQPADPPASAGEDLRREAERRRRRASVFGEVLPEATSDDRPDTGDTGDTGGRDAAEDWLRRQVPPHHG